MIAEFLGGSVGGTLAVIAGQVGPQIATPEEAVTVPLAYGVGAATGGQVYDLFMGLFSPKQETRTFLEQSSDAGREVMVNAVGVKFGEVAEKLLKKGVSSGARLARSSSDNIYKAFKSMGVKPTAGTVSGSQTIQGIENALSKLPASADVIGKQYGKLLDDIGEYALNISKGISPVEGREMVGFEVKKGLRVFTKKFTKKASTLYDEVDRYIIPSTKVQASNFGKQISETSGKYANDPEFGEILTSPIFKKLKAAYTASEARGGMRYSTLKALRTDMGNALQDPKALLGDTAQAEIKLMYGALSDDLAIAASNAGPEALKAANRASKFWSAGRSRIDDVLTPVINKKLNQDIFQAAMSGSKSGGQKLRALKKSLPKKQWDSVVANQIKEMGRATPGRQDVTGELFSPATFLTNFSKLSKGAKNVLFTGQQYKGLDVAISNLTKVSAALKDTVQMANTSGTAQQMIYMQVLTGGMGGLYGAEEGESVTGGVLKGMAVGAALPWVTAKLITSPKFVNWLADAGKTTMTKSAIGQHLGLLTSIAANDKLLAPAIYEYTRTISASKLAEKEDINE